MLKQLLALIVFSILIIMSMSYAQQGLQWLVDAHDWISQMLTDVFSGGQAGNLIRGLLALLSIPFIVASIPTVLFWFIRRHWFPYFMQTVWVVWLLQTGALVVLYTA